MIGKTIKHFRITAKLGEGGMGAVYRAEDTRLGREVALKILPREFTADPNRIQRFEREARALAALNHPNIAAVHETGEQDDLHFIVMELVPGDSLADRSARGPLPLEDAFSLALQVARALEAAHSGGIIHRDLKPLNLRITPEGQVKVLDFGLAKMLDPEPLSQVDENATTVVKPPSVTQAGMIFGTPDYMSPEQVRGESLDARTDIWAFGCVLYEMLTGKGPFARPNPRASMSAVLSEEPDWDALPARLPRSVRLLLERCLRKDPTERLHHVADVRIELEDVLKEGGDEPETSGTGVPPPRSHRTLLIGAIAIVAALAGVLLGVVLWAPNATAPPPVRAVIRPPEGMSFQLHPVHPGPAAVSADGTRIVFAARADGALPQLWIRRLDALEPRLLAGTENATDPFWSQDGRYVAFVVEGRLKKIRSDGGPVLTLVEQGVAGGGSWNAKGDILFTGTDGGIWRVSASGGNTERVTELDRSTGNGAYLHPRFLPDGEHFLFVARRSGEQLRQSDPVFLGSLSGDESRQLFRSSSWVEFAHGHLWFTREGALLARPFDPQTAEFKGPAVPVAKGAVASEWAAYFDLGYFSVSPAGVIAYHPSGSDNQKSILTWYDRDGTPLAAIGDPEYQYHVSPSPDGTRAAVQLVNPGGPGVSIWIYELSRGQKTRITFSPNSAVPVWSPDGERIAFSSNRTGELQVYLETPGQQDAEPLFEGGPGNYPRTGTDDDRKIHGAFPLDWSSDGKYMVYCTFYEQRAADLWAVSLEDRARVIPIEQSPFTEEDAAVSPDGKWIAYTSNASGHYEVYLARFPEGSRSWQVSSGGGIRPEWNPRGGELFFISSKSELKSAELSLEGDAPVVESVQTLFEVEGRYPVFAEPGIYGVGPNGNRFLINRVVDSSSPSFLIVLVGWPEEILQGS